MTYSPEEPRKFINDMLIDLMGKKEAKTFEQNVENGDMSDIMKSVGFMMGKCLVKAKDDPEFLTTLDAKVTAANVNSMTESERALYKVGLGTYESHHLYQLIKYGDKITPEYLDSLVKLGADVNYSENGISMLSLAQKRGDTKLVKLLRKYGA
ncbi:Hypothetical protein HVR_LOCUS1351 [uncultured virus]|nr:Hypothetical protein HVR_LOCUS1351 [uncultured virus]